MSTTDFFAQLHHEEATPDRTDGTAIYLGLAPGKTPPALVLNLRHNHVIHDEMIMLYIVFEDSPRVSSAERSEVDLIEDGVWQVILRYGFMETPHVKRGLKEGAVNRLLINTSTASFFIGTQSMVVANRPGMTIWRTACLAYSPETPPPRRLT